MNDHPNRIVRSADRCHCTTPDPSPTPAPRPDAAQEVDAARAALTAAVEAPDEKGSSARIDQATRRYIAASKAWREEQRAEAERRQGTTNNRCLQGLNNVQAQGFDPAALIASLRASASAPPPRIPLGNEDHD